MAHKIKKSFSWKVSDLLFSLGSLIPVIETLYLILSRSSFYIYLNGIPLNDSKVWYGCIKSLVLSNSWPVENVDWCLRRPFYPLIASQIYKLVPNLNIYFLVFSFLFSIILFFTIKELRRFAGDFAALIGLLCATLLWLVYGATQTLSEQVGISLGTLSFCFFLRYVSSTQTHALYFGSVFLLIAQLTRPGNVFSYVIPFLLVVLYENRKFISLLRLIVVCYLPLVALVALIRKIFDIPNFMHSGNTWATIYGLQFGNQSWSASYSILPDGLTTEPEIWDYIREFTIEDIKSHPFNIIDSIFRNIFNIVNFGPLNLQIFVVLFSIFIFSLYHSYRLAILPLRLIFLIVFVSVTELLTYGLSYNSDPIRTMSTSLVLTCSLIAIPISAILRFYWLGSRTTVNSSRVVDLKRFEISTLVMVSVFCTVGIFSSLSTPKSPNTFSATRGENSCSQKIVLSDIPSKYVQHQNLTDIVGKHGEWWISSINDLKSGSLLLVTSIDEDGSTHDTSIYLADVEVGELSRGDILCIQESKTLSVTQLGFQEGFVAR